MRAKGASRTPLQSAIHALARREYGRKELERRLQREFKDPDSAALIAAALDRLEREGMLSEARMAQSFVRSRAERYGRTRIAAELERRGVAEETISSVLPDPHDESRAATELWQRRFGAQAPDARGRARQARFLAARGFPHSVIDRLVFRSPRDPPSEP